MLGFSREVVFGLLRDLLIGESERSPFGLVAREPEAQPATGGSMSLSKILAEAARMADARHGPPRAPESGPCRWMVGVGGRVSGTRGARYLSKGEASSRRPLATAPAALVKRRGGGGHRRFTGKGCPC
jgi:hypothetical protein